MDKKFYSSAQRDLVLDWADKWFELTSLIIEITDTDGPLISPAMVRKFMAPCYKKITDLLHSNGVDVIFVDSDGRCDEHCAHGSCSSQTV